MKLAVCLVLSSAFCDSWDISVNFPNITKCNLLIRGWYKILSHLPLEGDFLSMRSLTLSQSHSSVMVQSDPLSSLMEERPGGGLGFPVRGVSLPASALLYTTSAADFLQLSFHPLLPLAEVSLYLWVHMCTSQALCRMNECRLSESILDNSISTAQISSGKSNEL